MGAVDNIELENKTIPADSFEIIGNEIRAIYDDVSVTICSDGEISVQFPDEVEWSTLHVPHREKNGFLLYDGFRNDNFFNGMDHEEREFWKDLIEELSKYNPNALGLLEDHRNRPKQKLKRVK